MKHYLFIFIFLYLNLAEFGSVLNKNNCKFDEYLKEFKFLPNHPPNFIQNIAHFHALHREQISTNSEFNFIFYASKCLQLYGYDLYNAKVLFNKFFY